MVNISLGSIQTHMQIHVTASVYLDAGCCHVSYSWLQVLPQRLSEGPVPEAQSHLHLPQEHVPPQGFGVPHRQVQGPTTQLPNSHFVLKRDAYQDGREGYIIQTLYLWNYLVCLLSLYAANINL